MLPVTLSAKSLSTIQDNTVELTAPRTKCAAVKHTAFSRQSTSTLFEIQFMN